MRILPFVLLTLMACDPKLIERKVARDSIKSYDLAVKGGDQIEVCVRAGIVVAAFNQAHMEAEYLGWKKVEKLACETARMSN